MILIAGSTGNIGRALVPLIVNTGQRLRTISCNGSGQYSRNSQIEHIEGDMRNRSFLRSSFHGVKKLFMLPMVLDQHAQGDRAFVEEAARAGVERIVLISSVAPDDTQMGHRHRLTEEIIASSGMGWTILRTSALMSNAFQWIPSIRRTGVVRTAIARGTLASIAPADVARVASEALTCFGHVGTTYDLTGCEVLTVKEQVGVLSAVLGIQIDCQEIGVDEMADEMSKREGPAWLTDAVRQMYGRIRDLRIPLITSDVERLTGVRPRTFQTWCTENRSKFDPPAARGPGGRVNLPFDKIRSNSEV